MSKQISRQQTPTGAYRRPLFNPCGLSADDTDEFITFDVSPLSEPDVVDDAPSRKGSRPRYLMLGLFGASTVAVLAVVVVLVAGAYTMTRSADAAPQITGAAGEPVDMNRD
jgi:hypothetical protein